MYRWTPEMIRFLEDAAGKTEYYRKLAERLAALLPNDARICDVGCGLGHLAELLCDSFASVTAIDSSRLAIDAFQRRLGTHVPENLHILCEDAFTLPPETKFDAMVFCYFGSLPEILRVARQNCAGSVVIIRRNDTRHRFDLGRHPRLRATAADTVQTLLEMGVECRAEALRLEFGQPLRSKEDALQFFRLYLRDPAQTVDWETVAPKLVETGDTAFPYYFPQSKDVSILQFDAAQIPPEAKEPE